MHANITMSMILYIVLFLFFNETSTTDIYTYFHSLSRHDALPSSSPGATTVFESAWPNSHVRGANLVGQAPGTRSTLPRGEAWRADPRQPEARVFRATSVLGHVQLAAAAEP